MHDIDRRGYEGSFPLLSPYCWFGGNLAGKYGFGIFSVVHLLVILVVFHFGAIACKPPVNRSHVCGDHGQRGLPFGATYGLTIPTALIVCLAATLNGWSYYWGARYLDECLLGMCLVALGLVAPAIAVDYRYGVRRFLPAGIFLYLLLAAGWPYGVLMAAVVTMDVPKTSGLWHPLRSWPVVCVGPGAGSWQRLPLLTFVEFYSIRSARRIPRATPICGMCPFLPFRE